MENRTVILKSMIIKLENRLYDLKTHGTEALKIVGSYTGIQELLINLEKILNLSKALVIDIQNIKKQIKNQFGEYREKFPDLSDEKTRNDLGVDRFEIESVINSSEEEDDYERLIDVGKRVMEYENKKSSFFSEDKTIARKSAKGLIKEKEAFDACFNILEEALDLTTTKKTILQINKSDKPVSIPERKIVYPKKTKTREGFFIPNKGFVDTEEFALNHYQANGFEGFFSENYYWWKIMELLYWEEIYNYSKLRWFRLCRGRPHKDGFFFVTTQIPEKLSEERTSALRKLSSLEIVLRRAWELRKNERNRLGFDLVDFSLEQLVFATRVLQTWQIVSIVEPLIKDFNKCRCGFPDLFLAHDGVPLFAEVKRQGERISESQSEWHEYLSNTVKVNVEICRVVEQLEKTITPSQKGDICDIKPVNILAISSPRIGSESLQEENRDIENIDFGVLPIPCFRLRVPKRTLKLLFFSGKDPETASFVNDLHISINLFEETIKTNELPADDPSTIFKMMLIKKPDDVNSVPRPDYYPTYVSLSPEQKWIYINWLQDISRPVNIGYVFLYYYGLERQLVSGDFDSAFDEIIYLRKYHDNQSFKIYSNGTLVFSSLLKGRQDRLKMAIGMLEPGFFKNLHLVCAYYCGYDFTAKNLIYISESITSINKRYMRSNPDLFEKVLNECLTARYNKNIFPFASKYKITDLPVKNDVLFANISFPPRHRNPEVPNFLTYPPFIKELESLLKEAHEKVKISVRESRKQKR